MDRYYVYLHRHPCTNEIVYIGMGQNDRAWAITSKARGQDHREFLNELTNLGFIASDWTEIVKRQMTRQAAYDYERELISQHLPVFNKDKHQHRMTEWNVVEAALLRQSGETYKQIGDALGFHPWTIRHRLKKEGLNAQDPE